MQAIATNINQQLYTRQNTFIQQLLSSLNTLIGPKTDMQPQIEKDKTYRAKKQDYTLIYQTYH